MTNQQDKFIRNYFNNNNGGNLTINNMDIENLKKESNFMLNGKDMMMHIMSGFGKKISMYIIY